MGVQTLEQRIKDNTRNYTLSMLLGAKEMQMYFTSFAEAMDMEVLMTDRRGAEVAKVGSIRLEDFNTGQEPGRTIILQGRTMGHLYVRKADGSELSLEEEAFVDATQHLLERLAGQIYTQKETNLYVDTKENSETPGMKIHNLEKEDGLTGVFNKNYYDNRLKIIDRAEVVPVAVICANINDWKFVNDNWGDDESDRLIAMIAEILKEEAKEEYVIGRVDGDVFQILIPMAQDGEAEEYKERVQKACLAKEDERLSPSVAIGICYKTNIEQNLNDLASDAEYEMFEDKFALKNEAGYQERLRRAL